MDQEGLERCADGEPGQNAEDPDRARCRRFTYEYDKADNQTAQVEDPAAEGDPAALDLRSETRYDANDNEVARTDPRGHTSRKEYDQNDRPVAEIDEKDRRKETEYRPDDKVIAEISPKGTASIGDDNDHRTEHTYNPNGELESRSLPHDTDQYGSKQLKVSYERDPVGNPTKIVDARGSSAEPAKRDAHSFRNTFFDSGELKSTERPSWFKSESGQGGGQGEGGGSQQGQGGQGGGQSQGGGGSSAEGGGQGQSGSVTEKSPEE